MRARERGRTAARELRAFRDHRPSLSTFDEAPFPRGDGLAGAIRPRPDPRVPWPVQPEEQGVPAHVRAEHDHHPGGPAPLHPVEAAPRGPDVDVRQGPRLRSVVRRESEQPVVPDDGCVRGQAMRSVGEVVRFDRRRRAVGGDDGERGGGGGDADDRGEEGADRADHPPDHLAIRRDRVRDEDVRPADQGRGDPRPNDGHTWLPSFPNGDRDDGRHRAGDKRWTVGGNNGRGRRRRDNGRNNRKRRSVDGRKRSSDNGRSGGGDDGGGTSSSGKNLVLVFFREGYHLFRCARYARDLCQAETDVRDHSLHANLRTYRYFELEIIRHRAAVSSEK